MANSTSITYRLKRKILTFTNKISRRLSKPDQKLTADMVDEKCRIYRGFSDFSVQDFCWNPDDFLLCFEGYVLVNINPRHQPVKQTPARKDSGPPTAFWAIDSRRGQTTAYRSERSRPVL